MQSQPQPHPSAKATGQGHGQQCPVQQQWPTAKDMASKDMNEPDSVSLAASSGSAATAQYPGFDSDDDFVLDEATLAIMDGRAVSAPTPTPVTATPTAARGRETPAAGDAGFTQLSPDDFVLDEATLALMDGLPAPPKMPTSAPTHAYVHAPAPSFALAPVSGNTLPGPQRTGEARKRGAESIPLAATPAATKQRVSVLYTDD